MAGGPGSLDLFHRGDAVIAMSSHQAVLSDVARVDVVVVGVTADLLASRAVSARTLVVVVGHDVSSDELEIRRRMGRAAKRKARTAEGYSVVAILSI